MKNHNSAPFLIYYIAIRAQLFFHILSNITNFTRLLTSSFSLLTILSIQGKQLSSKFRTAFNSVFDFFSQSMGVFSDKLRVLHSSTPTWISIYASWWEYFCRFESQKTHFMLSYLLQVSYYPRKVSQSKNPEVAQFIAQTYFLFGLYRWGYLFVSIFQKLELDVQFCWSKKNGNFWDRPKSENKMLIFFSSFPTYLRKFLTWW